MPIEINYIAVFVAAIVSMVIGAAWYSPFLFGSKWLEIMRWSDEEMEVRKRGMGKTYFLSFVSALVMAYVIAYAIAVFQAETITEGARIGFFAWLGFVATTSLASVLFEGRPKGLYLLNNAYNLVALLVMGAILAVM